MAQGVSSGSTGTGTGIFLSGVASKINTAALVEAAYNQRVSKATKVDLKISKNQNKITSYGTMNGLAKDVMTALNKLKSQPGAIATGNEFDKKLAYTSSATLTNPTSFVAVTADKTVPLQSFDLEIVRTAKAMKAASGAGLVASSSAALGYTGSFDIGLPSMTAGSINVTASMSLTDIANAINATKTTSGVSASIIQVTPGDFRLNIQANKAAENITITPTGGTNVMQSLGVINGGGIFQNIVQAADTAEIKIDGITLNRNTNTITDAITGVTIDLLAQSPGNTIKVDIENDTSSVKTAVQGFIDAFNEFRDFYIANNARNSDGTIKDDAYLYNDTLMNQINSQMQQLISRQVSNAGDLTSLNSIGLKLDGQNKLYIADETKLDNAILNNFDNVKNLFQTEFTTNNANLGLIRNSSTQASLTFALDITVDGGGNVTSASVGGNGSLFTFSGNSITGAVGTIYEGLTFAYVGGVNTSINVDIQQGFADAVYNYLEPNTNGSTGKIVTAVENLKSNNNALTEESTDIKNSAEDYRQQLIDKYAKMEAEVQKGQLLRRQLQALLGKNSSDDDL